jgi:hypothetical protein
MAAKVKVNGRKMLKKLCGTAKEKGIPIGFHINENAKYVLTRGKRKLQMPTASAACHFVMGMIEAANIKS